MALFSLSVNSMTTPVVDGWAANFRSSTPTDDLTDDLIAASDSISESTSDSISESSVSSLGPSSNSSLLLGIPRNHPCRTPTPSRSCRNMIPSSWRPGLVTHSQRKTPPCSFCLMGSSPTITTRMYRLEASRQMARCARGLFGR